MISFGQVSSGSLEMQEDFEHYLHKSLLSAWMKLRKPFLRLWIYAQQALQASAWEALVKSSQTGSCTPEAAAFRYVILSLVPYKQWILGTGSRDTVDFISAFLELEHGVRPLPASVFSGSMCYSFWEHFVSRQCSLREQLTLLHRPWNCNGCFAHEGSHRHVETGRGTSGFLQFPVEQWTSIWNWICTALGVQVACLVLSVVGVVESLSELLPDS